MNTFRLPRRGKAQLSPAVAASAQFIAELLERRTLLTTFGTTIAQENALTGTPESTWDLPVANAGDSTLQGYATDMSVLPGQTISFKITDTQKVPYSINFYRIGYYQGTGARLIDSLSTAQTLQQVQPAPLVDNTTGLVDAGNWAVSASWTVPTNALSGVYLADLCKNGAAVSQIVFVVRNDSSHSDLLFKTDDATWEAYNQWGNGNSFYTGSSVDGSLGIPTNAGGNTDDAPTNRAVEASYNRPLGNRGQPAGYGNDSQFFYAEFPMVRFLEANGYDVSYTTDVNTNSAGYASIIEQHKVFMSVGHDEYWSGNEYANVMAARNAGVNMAFMSGNSVYWKTYYINSTANTDGTTQSSRVLVCFKESWANQVIDPTNPNTWTGTYQDPRFSPPADGGTPENALTGTVFGINTMPSRYGAGLTVPSTDAALRLWRNTTVASLAAGQSTTLGQDIIGYEADLDIDNGFRPAGEMDLSSTTIAAPQVLLDYGSTTGPQTVTHSITLYRASSGALVFSSGSVQWAWGLDGDHDGPQPLNPNAAIQQATVNLFADMKVQPATLQSGLVAATASTDTTPPASTITAPAPNATVTSGTPVTITGTATDAGGGVVGGVEISTDGGKTWHPVTGTGTGNATHFATWSYTWTPGATGAVRLQTRAVDDSGNLEAPSAGVAVTVQPSTTSLTLFASNATPANVNSGDNNGVELGLRFTSDVSGFITGIRFYKASANTGTHVGNLWSNSGTLLATATFTNESASGWQQVNFSQPVAITAGTIYVASYYAPNGDYSFNAGGFAHLAVNNGPLHGLEDSAAGRNGLFAYASSTTFPSNPSPSSNNYWVDVVFSASNGAPATVTSETPAPNAINVPVASAVTATLSKAVQPSNISMTLTTAAGAAVAGTFSYNSTTNTASFQPSAALAAGTAYTASISDTTDGLAATSWSFTSAPSDSLWSASTTPASPSINDSNAVTVGTTFFADTNGSVTGVRFYKGSGNTGTHVGGLWTAGGQLLASVTFTSESSTGWQEANFTNPVAITANTNYVVGYLAPKGHYAGDSGYFTNVYNNAPLHAPSGNNGLYVYGASLSFPNASWQSTNYYVDAVFAPSSTTDTTPPTVVAQAPTSGATGVATSTTVTATFSESVTASTISFVLKDASNNTVPATVTYNAGTQTATLTPNAALGNSTTYTATVSGAADPSGNVMTPVSWSFTTAAVGAPTYSFWSNSTTPSVADDSDPHAVELGVKFTSSAAGQVTGIRFYKGPTNTGTHVGNLWSSTGTLLATATFTGETASGWQTVTFSQPVTIQPGTVYVASYHTNVGKYSDDSGYFTSSGVTNGPITALSDGAAGGNGVYAYTSASAFPTSTFGATNYWVDIVFTPTATNIPPTVTGNTPASGATNLATNTTVTATFSEPVTASTISFVLKDASNNTVAATVTYNAGTQTATLTPNAALKNLTTYTATVSGATDSNGNVMTPVSWSFTTAAAPMNQWVQSSVADFSAGTQSNTVVTNEAGGQVQLAQTSDDFTGTALGAAWTTTSWASAGGGPASVTVANSILSVGGAQVASGTVPVGTPIEASVSFAAAPYQHFGLASSLSAVAGSYWAIFSTLGTTNTLYARVNINGATQDVSLGALPTGMHDYLIQPVSGGFQFYVDGVLKTTINGTIPTGTAIKAMFSEFGGSPQAPMQVDWVRYGNFASSGTFTSSVFNAGKTATIASATWAASVPAGTTMTVQLRVSNDGANWSSWQTVTNGTAISPSLSGQFFQYQVTFNTTSLALTPTLNDMTINWS